MGVCGVVGSGVCVGWKGVGGPEDCGWSGGSGEVGGWHVLQGVIAMAKKDV